MLSVAINFLQRLQQINLADSLFWSITEIVGETWFSTWIILLFADA
jgi:hypothetical protein